MIIGIYTPYRRDEVTVSALRLADLAIQLGLTVKLISPGSIERPVHPYWDGRVKSSKVSNAIYRWANGCDSLIWFDHDLKSVSNVSLVNEHAQKVLVWMWHRFPERLKSTDLPYTHVMCPSVASLHSAIEHVFEDRDQILRVCPWSSGLEVIRRQGTIEDQSISIYVQLDGLTMDELGAFPLIVCEEILGSYPDSRFTLDCGKSWPKSLRNKLRKMSNQFEGRLQIYYRSDLVTQQHLLTCHDWAWLPSTRTNTGVYALRALACGTPVITPDVPPFQEYVIQDVNGLVVDCDTAFNWLDAPITSSRLANTLNKFTQAMKLETLSKCQKAKWQVIRVMEEDFRLAWMHLWGIELS